MPAPFPCEAFDNGMCGCWDEGDPDNAPCNCDPEDGTCCDEYDDMCDDFEDGYHRKCKICGEVLTEDQDYCPTCERRSAENDGWRD